MRKLTAIIFLMLSCLVQVSAEEHLRERVYLATDKDVYVSGDKLWCSAFCVDVNTGRFSEFSRVAYVEVHSADGLVQTGKIALDHGRGAGTFTLQASLPTGNYIIIAYTAQSCNEKGYDYYSCAKTISVFNTLSNSRIKGGVKLLGDDEYPDVKRPAAASGQLKIETPADASRSSSAVLRITNTSDEKVQFSLSVSHDDGIASPVNGSIGDFIGSLSDPGPAVFTNSRTAEYEGGIIRARLVGNPDKFASLSGEVACISVPSQEPNVYISRIGSNGEAVFYTNNIYGDKDLFLEVGEHLENLGCHLEPESPFVNPEAPRPPELALAPRLGDALALRGTAMQICSCFDADTLYSLLPMDVLPLLENPVRYVLDDYTRFPVMEELFIEFISQARYSRENGNARLEVFMNDFFRNAYYPQTPPLVMLDGVPVFDLEKVFAYDPLLVKYIDIYQSTCIMGSNVFSGAVNFITYKGTLPSFSFGDNVRVVSYQGVSYPLAFTCEGVGSDYPDYRQTVYWHPLMNLEAGESVEIICKTPSYGGKFRVAAEGLTASMQPAVAVSSFTIH